MDATQVLQYYREHSVFTDQGKYAALYEELPRDVPGLVQVVQGLIIPQGWSQFFTARENAH